MPRMIYLATADARGHLMRAQLLVHALRAAGVHVEVLTTSDAGQRFLEGFGIQADILSHHYAVQFDALQNMLRGATNRNVACYVFAPTRMLRDILQLRRQLRTADLVINDSFHPALLFMGTLPFWRRKVIHVYGVSLREALLSNFDGASPGLFSKIFRRIVAWQITTARARFEHDFAYEMGDTENLADCRLPTPVPIAKPLAPGVPKGAIVYLNPHFRAPSLADALSAGIQDAGLEVHRVGEGYTGRPGWVSVDPDWISRAAHAQVIVSAPGMAALSIALVYGRPIILVLTDQPEQTTNARRAQQLRIPHRIVTWTGDPADFRLQVGRAAAKLSSSSLPSTPAVSGCQAAQARLDAWTDRLLALCSAPLRSSPSKAGQHETSGTKFGLARSSTGNAGVAGDGTQSGDLHHH